MDLHVFVDGKEIGRPFITAKFKNNRDASVYEGNKKIPAFSFSISEKPLVCKRNDMKFLYEYGESANAILGLRIEPGVDSAFVKALKKYFKNKDNWITFNIVPRDICEASLWVKGDAYDNESKSLWNPRSDGPYTGKESDINTIDTKKVFKIQNNEIKNIRLAYSGWGNNGKGKVTMLKMDKKFNESKPNRKKDFHAEILNDKYIKITGQGNFCNSFIIQNPYN